MLLVVTIEQNGSLVFQINNYKEHILREINKLLPNIIGKTDIRSKKINFCNFGLLSTTSLR